MTTTTASDRGRANVARGKEAERQVARYLSVALGITAIRYVRAGHRRADDPGDLSMGEHLICDVKDDLEIDKRLITWMDALDKMDGHDTAVRFLVAKWRQHPLDRWHVYIRAGMLAPLIMGSAEADGADVVRTLAGQWALRTLWARPADRLRVPVRLELGPFAAMLVASGFGGHTGDEHGSG